MTHFRSIFCALSLLALSPLYGEGRAPARPEGTNANAAFNDNIDRTDPNFVRASLLVIGPDDVLYSRLGHSCLRMQCEKFGLDTCYTYESEDIPSRLFSYFAGTLTMGMFAVPTTEFLKVQRKAGRGVVQYEMSLPPAAKIELYRILDAKVAEGFHLPYDSLQRGCAQSIIKCLNACVRPATIICDQWPKSCEGTIRETCLAALKPYPWSQFILNAIYGIEIDQEVGKSKRIILPVDLLEYLKSARIGDVRVLASDPIVLEDQLVNMDKSYVTPLFVSILMLIMAIVNFKLDLQIVRIAFVVCQFVLGLFFTYLMLNSRVSTGWNWLVVPFNPLPALFWKWRMHWSGYLSLCLVAWIFVMVISTHHLTYAPCLVVAGAFAISYAQGAAFFKKVKG